MCCRRQLAQDGDLLRLSIDTRDWSLQRRHLVPSPASTDFSVINPAFNTRPYTYIFTVYGIYTDTPQSLVKVSRRRNLVFFLITRSVFKIGFYSAGRSHCRCTKVSYRMSPLPVYFYIRTAESATFTRTRYQSQFSEHDNVAVIRSTW